MRYVIIENGIVINAIEADAIMAAANGWVQTDTAGPGCGYSGGTFTEPPRDINIERAAIQTQIDTLEREQLMPRLTREIFLPLMVTTASSQGVDEPTLYAASIGYRKLKDFEAQIVALRDQLVALV